METDNDLVLNRLLDAVNFELGHVGTLFEAGFITEEYEFGFLLSKALDGLNSYPVEIVIPENKNRRY